MPRITIEDDLETHPEFWNLAAIAGGDREKALGRCVLFFRLAQKRFVTDGAITEEELSQCGLKDMIKSGFAIPYKNGYQVKNPDRHFGWLRTRIAASVKGGEANKARLEKIAKGSHVASHTVAKRSPLTLSPSLSLKNKTRTLATLAQRHANSPSKETPVASRPPAENSGLVVDKPTNAVQFLIATYIEAWQARYKTKARPEVKKCIGIFKSMLTQRKAQEIAQLLQVYCQMDDKWFLTKHHDVATFHENIGKVAVALDKGHERSNGEKHWTDIAKERGSL